MDCLRKCKLIWEYLIYLVDRDCLVAIHTPEDLSSSALFSFSDIIFSTGIYVGIFKRN